LKRILNLNGRSRIYAVFGDPVAQVQTPHMINPLFEEYGKNCFAVPFHVTPEMLGGVWEVFRSFSNLAGIGVTVPHKVTAFHLCDDATPAAKAVGAVNSIQRRPDGRMVGALFDGIGFVNGLGDHRSRLRGARVLLFGGGGAGRAIAHALVDERIAALGIVDLDGEATQATVALVNQAAGDTLAGPASDFSDSYDVIINATPVGVKSNGRLPVRIDALGPSVLVADIAALDRHTELLQTARARGCMTSDGNDMLRAQIKLIAGFATGAPAGVEISG
jgi:shikimate dehydrogenase